MSNTNGDDYNNAGSTFWRAWRILSEGCEYPPSLEVFRAAMLDQRRQRPHVNVEQAAEAFVASYRRIR